MRIALAQINPIIGNLSHNTEKICDYIEGARKKGVDIILFPEMALIGYPPEDLVLLPSFIQAVEKFLNKVIRASQGIAVVVGTVRENSTIGEKRLFNTAAIIEDRNLLGFQDKTLLPDYDVFSERRYFEPSSQSDVWTLKGHKIGITICEDIWHHAGEVVGSFYTRDPIQELKEKKPEILLNLSASPYYMRRLETRLSVCTKAAKTLSCPVLLCNQVGGNDSLIFDGYSLYIDACGQLVSHAQGFQEELFIAEETSSSLPQTLSSYIQDLYQALVLGVRDYFNKQGFRKACLGLSGGIDSAVVACIAAEALGREEVLALFLPSRYSSGESQEDALELAKRIGIHLKEVSIEKPFQSFLEVLSSHFAGLKTDHTEENIQARIRGILLMAFSNKLGYLVLSTGNKSEMAMGYATLYGDMCGGLAVLGDVSKEQVYALAKWINRDQEIIPYRILEKSPSAELRPNQKDTDSLPEYPVVDAVLADYIEEHYSPEEIAEKRSLPLSLVRGLVKRIHLNEYKRRQAPPSLRVTKKSFTVGRRFPIVQHWNVYVPEK